MPATKPLWVGLRAGQTWTGMAHLTRSCSLTLQSSVNGWYRGATMIPWPQS